MDFLRNPEAVGCILDLNGSTLRSLEMEVLVGCVLQAPLVRTQPSNLQVSRPRHLQNGCARQCNVAD